MPGDGIDMSRTLELMAKTAGSAGVAVVLGALACCATVHQEDLDAWAGAPVISLDKHPVFLTLPVVRTMAADGTEIRNYVDGHNIESCAGDGSIFRAAVPFTTYSGFSHCVQSFVACNNIFYIKGGVVTQYTPVGSGGARCATDERLRPGGAARGTNIR
jgi:hypothetical protein